MRFRKLRRNVRKPGRLRGFRRLRNRIVWKQSLLYAALIAFMMVLLPALMVNLISRETDHKTMDMDSARETPDLHLALGEETFLLNVYDARQKKVVEMNLDEYLVGVVAAEMPAGFHEEALKAQAVAARTYALHRTRRLGGRGCSSHPEADVCTDSTCCQAWVGEAEMNAKWPADAAKAFREKIVRAVLATRGAVVISGERLAQTLYHSTCGGMTEAAGYVWEGSNPDYLQSVQCSYCRHSKHYRNELTLELADYVAALKNESGLLPVLSSENAPHMEVVRRSPSGRNLLVRLGNPGRLFPGTEVRCLLGLPSTHFQWHLDENRIIFETRGFGHGVGLCQFGADGMAAEGKQFEDILAYYYRGTAIAHWSTLFPEIQSQDTNTSPQ